MKKIFIIAPILIITAVIVLILFFLNKKDTANIIDGNCVQEGKESYGEAPVVRQCCPGLKIISAIDNEGNRIYDVAYCTKCGDDACKKPENKYNCPEDCK